MEEQKQTTFLLKIERQKDLPTDHNDHLVRHQRYMPVIDEIHLTATEVIEVMAILTQIRRKNG